MRIISVVGARPNFMKIAPLIKAFKKYQSVNHTLIHTGQHYDAEMSDNFFKDLNIKKPKINLNIGSADHAAQTAKIMTSLEKIFINKKPDLVLVVGDVNSTLAASLVAVKQLIPIAHIEAGLRSFDRTMPEEINRLITDQLSSYLFTDEPAARINLLREGVNPRKIFYVGNIMIDSLLSNLKRAKELSTLKTLKLKSKKYALLTLHRPSNVDNKKVYKNIIRALKLIQKNIIIVWPIHPRSTKMLKRFNLSKSLNQLKNFLITPPLSYLNFLNLMSHSRFAMTDSGGIQEETTLLGIPCLTLRNNTERPITITQGTNILVGTDYKKIIHEVDKIIEGKNKKGKIPKFWDGKTAERIVKVILQKHNKYSC